MIENNLQYWITRATVAEFANGLAELDARGELDAHLHPLARKAERDSLYYQMIEMEEDLCAYESSRPGQVAPRSGNLFVTTPRQPMKAADQPHAGPLLVVLTGPTGVGKDAVLNRLKEREWPGWITVTVTTRPMRAGETDGIDYYFISREDYDRLRDAGELLEHAEFNQHGYGIPRAQVREALAAGQDVLLRIDPQGAATIGKLAPGAVRIFLAPPSMEELERRLRGRKSETPEGLARRLAIAEREMQRAAECEYVVLNEDGKLDVTVEQILAIMTAERCRVGRRPVTV